MSEFFGAVIGILVVVVLVLQFWSFIWPVLMWILLIIGGFYAVIAGISGVIEHYKKKEREARAVIRHREQNIEEEQRKKAVLAAEQKHLRLQLEKCTHTIRIAQLEVTTSEEKAGKYYEIAVTEFEERAFAPFWDAIEKVATNLSNLNFSNKTIVEKIDEYSRIAKLLDSEIPTLETSLLYTNTSTSLGGDLSKLVRKAQRDHQFATIFEQRKTNKVLISGFSSLSDALSEMEDTLRRTGDEMYSAIRDFELSTRDTGKDSLRILDNIQRGKVPPPRDSDRSSQLNDPHEVWVE